MQPNTICGGTKKIFWIPERQKFDKEIHVTKTLLLKVSCLKLFYQIKHWNKFISFTYDYDK